MPAGLNPAARYHRVALHSPNSLGGPRSSGPQAPVRQMTPEPRRGAATEQMIHGDRSSTAGQQAPASWSERLSAIAKNALRSLIDPAGAHQEIQQIGANIK